MADEDTVTETRHFMVPADEPPTKARLVMYGTSS